MLENRCVRCGAVVDEPTHSCEPVSEQLMRLAERGRRYEETLVYIRNHSFELTHATIHDLTTKALEDVP